MKFERIIYGVILLFIGGVLLLSNFDVIDFYWRNIWGFWPVFLIIGGLNLLFNRNGSQAGSKLSLMIIIVMLVFLFFKGQDKPDGGNSWFNWRDRIVETRDDHEENDQPEIKRLQFSEPYLLADSSKKAILNLSGGGTSFTLEDSTDSLFTASLNKKNKYFSLQKLTTDSTNTLTFKMNSKQKGKGNNWSLNAGGNEVDIRLNTNPLWEMNVKMGAGELDFDLTNYKLRELNFDGGAANVVVKLGERLPIVDLTVKTGMANVEIKIPANSGCRIKTNTGLSAKNFDGFVKISDGTYETPNYKTAANKIFINLDGGLSNFEVETF